MKNPMKLSANLKLQLRQESGSIDVIQGMRIGVSASQRTIHGSAMC